MWCNSLCQIIPIPPDFRSLCMIHTSNSGNESDTRSSKDGYLFEIYKNVLGPQHRSTKNLVGRLLFMITSDEAPTYVCIPKWYPPALIDHDEDGYSYVLLTSEAKRHLRIMNHPPLPIRTLLSIVSEQNDTQFRNMASRFRYGAPEVITGEKEDPINPLLWCSMISSTNDSARAISEIVSHVYEEPFERVPLTRGFTFKSPEGVSLARLSLLNVFQMNLPYSGALRSEFEAFGIGVKNVPDAVIVNDSWIGFRIDTQIPGLVQVIATLTCTRIRNMNLSSESAEYSVHKICTRELRKSKEVISRISRYAENMSGFTLWFQIPVKEISCITCTSVRNYEISLSLVYDKSDGTMIEESNGTTPEAHKPFSFLWSIPVLIRAG